MLLKRKARLVLRLEMFSLLAFFLMPLIARYASPASQDLLDGVRGALLGAAIGLMITLGVIKRREGQAEASRTR